MDKLCSWMTENVDKMDDTDLAPFLLTSATLDYIPKQSEKLFEVFNHFMTSFAENIKKQKLSVSQFSAAKKNYFL